MNGTPSWFESSLSTLISRPAPVILGSLVLEGPEAPSRIVIGGSQLAAIHKLPGGGRVIDAIGPDDNAVMWHGIFIGPNAAQRVRVIDALRASGEMCAFSFGDYQFDILVTSFEYSYEARGAVISYRLRAERTQIISETGLTSGESGLVDLGVGLQILTNTRSSLATYEPFVASEASRALGTAINSMANLPTVTTTASSGTSSVNAEAITHIETSLTHSLLLISAGLPTGKDIKSAISNGAQLRSVMQNAGAMAAVVGAGGYVGRAARVIDTNRSDQILNAIHS